MQTLIISPCSCRDRGKNQVPVLRRHSAQGREKGTRPIRFPSKKGACAAGFKGKKIFEMERELLRTLCGGPRPRKKATEGVFHLDCSQGEAQHKGKAQSDRSAALRLKKEKKRNLAAKLGNRHNSHKGSVRPTSGGKKIHHSI